MVGDTILIKDISINGNDNLTNADQLSETLTDNTINALGIDASSRTIWINGQPYGNAYVNVKEGGTLEKPIGGEIFNDFEHNIASGDYSHASGFCTKTTNKAEAAFGKFNQSTKDSTLFSIGDGGSDSSRHNIVEVTKDEVNINTNLIVGSATTIGGGIDVKGSLEVWSSATIEGGLTVKNDIEVEGLGDDNSGKGDKLLKNSIIVAGSAEGSGVMKGAYNSAGGKNSLALGVWCKTTNEGEHASGKYNQSNNNTIHSVGIGTSTDDRKNAEEIHYNSGDKYVIGIGGYDGTNSVEAGVKTVQTVVNESINQITISYLKLKELRDASQLVPGKEYRINDYTCTTTQTGTRSAGNVFDIIVTADSESTLNEEARAINHEFDAPNQDHFKDCNLNAWQIWYCLDNDTTRFAWADKTNGKGVIYRMIDEWNNDAPYDFKNIQYNGSWGYWAYTFNWINNEGDNSCEDLSVAQYVHTNDEGRYSHTYGNVINPCELREDGNYGYPLKLNVCVFLNTETYDSGLFYGCSSNSFGNNCYENTFGNGCYGNAFGNNCYENTFGNNCYGNAFGNYCNGNTFRNGCYGNTFRHGCYSNAFGDRCYGNAFENYCNRIAFGNDCNSNVFGDSCSCIKFASDSSASTKYNYYQFNHFGDGCKYIVFTGTEPESSSQQVQNYNFAQGLRGTDSAYLTIDGVRNRAYETYISRDTDGTIRESVIADKLDKMIEITYKELYDLREANGLIPGQQYRIIDYTCTTIQKHTRSAGHDFDIIVTADSKNKLNEEARAIQHTDADDDYFDKCNLSAWKIWYCLDNDKDRFAWALGDKSYLGINFYQDYTYFEYVGPWTIEETNYTLCKISDNAFLGSTNLTPAPNDTVYKILYDNGSYQITNEKGTIFDISNINGGKGVIYRMIDEFGNDVPYDFKNIQFYRNWDDTKRLWSITSSPNNTINTQFLPCYTFSERQDKSSTSDDRDNSLLASNMVYSNVIKKYIEYNKQTLNNNCFFGIYDYSNNFGDNCYNNSFGAICRSNTFGNYCYSNIFGDDCERNTIGDMCHDIVLKINCIDNSFGNYCNNIILNARAVISDGTKYFDYYKQNQFGHGCKYITLDTSGMNTVTIKNYNFTKGLEGSEGSIITVNCKPRSYETTVSKTSTAYNGAEIFAYCLADVVLSVAPSKADPIKYT